MSFMSEIRNALNELYDSEGENVKEAIAHLNPDDFETLLAWDDEIWEGVVKRAFIHKPWRFKNMERLWAEKGDSIRAALENEINTLREAA